MNDRRLHSRNWILVLAVAYMMVAGACAADARRPGGSSGAGGETGGSTGTGGSGTGGNSGQGGTAEGGTSGGSGGATGGSGTGGSASGGVSGAGGETSGGASGGVAGGSGEGGDQGGAATGGAGGDAGGTTSAVPCTTDDDCSAGGKCRGGVCASLKACNNSTECGSGDLVCDPGRGLCVECAKAADCSDGQECLGNRCVTPIKCQSADDCSGQAGKVCDSSGRCVACAADDDCDDGQRCLENACRTTCDSDKTCTPDGMLCSSSLLVCVQCTDEKACAAGTYCDSSGMCEPAVCAAGESICSGDGVAPCKADGSGWGPAVDCPESKPCKAYGGVAGCGGPSGGADGGVTPEIDGGGIDAGPQTCTTATVDPCASIPPLEGTQTVDGKDEEFCGVPSFVLDKATASTAGAVNNFNGLKDEEFASVKARVAWSSAGLHAFFDVTDAKVESVSTADPNQALTAPYQGDSVELFIASNDTATGAPGGDSGTVVVTLAATGKSVSVTTTNNNGLSVTYAELPAAQVAQAKTESGYAIEALIPWKGDSPVSGAKVRFDLALNMADDNFGSVGDMRDAQIIYHVATVSGQTSCPGAAEPYCDDRTWCSTTLQ